jgi:hypothetical protein
MNIACCIAALLLFTAPAYAHTSYQNSLQHAFNTKRPWYVSAIAPTGSHAEFGDIAVRTCFWSNVSNKTCEKQEIHRNGMHYPMQTLLDLSVAPTPHLLKLSTQYSSGAGGLVTQVRFWRYDTPADRFVPAGSIDFSEQGEYQMTKDGLLITADAKVRAGETHFSPHHFIIKVYRYESSNGFVNALSYTTQNRYPSLDDTDRIDVISHELSEIRTHMKQLPAP